MLVQVKSTLKFMFKLKQSYKLWKFDIHTVPCNPPNPASESAIVTDLSIFGYFPKRTKKDLVIQAHVNVLLLAQIQIV